MSRYIVGMSGGVDSAVTCYLLKAAGHEVIGVTLKTWTPDNGEESRCCQISDAEAVAQVLDIPYYTMHYESEFTEKVTDPFIQDYLHGRTPNPCVFCNRYVKWEGLLKAASFYHADGVATGHYASIRKLPNGRYTVAHARSAKKDQTYMLYQLSQEQLAATLMPLGGLEKDEVREIARVAGLPIADKPDSQDICFVPSGTYSDFIEENAHDPIPGAGNFVTKDGQVLGTHKGITHYTIGQRQGLGLAMGHYVYVTEIRPDTNEVVIGESEDLFTRTVICGDVNFMAIEDLPIGESLAVTAKIRYRHDAAPAVLSRLDETRVQLEFEEPVRAVTPGQAAVFFQEDYILGGGIIL